jgi:hypothetical protein
MLNEFFMQKCQECNIDINQFFAPIAEDNNE